ncbi:MAG TPA: hypothetical protein VFC19_25180, partial [Candidatus Limnocylindrales bacterium]|nr:hypothetical protein [Candidatus Limnocylindrales bacterium]
MKSHLWAVLIALAAIGPAVAVAPTDLALGAGADPTSSVSPSPSASPSPSPSASASVSAKAPANSNLVPTPPRTNLVAVVDPIAVPVRDGVLIRVGARNSGRTLRVGQTYWQSFVFPDLSSLASGVE